ncbi:MAG: MFS transporter [Anaerolineaceae bacterium]|jgi:sugar (glycoside-pentoside-hexuronide) transporter
MKEGFVVPVKEKIAFALGDFGNNLVITAMGFYYLFFVVNVGGLTPVLAGVTYWVSRSVAACTDLLMGIVSDRTSSRFGRRRIYLLVGAIPMGASFMLLWLSPFNSQTALFFYYLTVMLCFNVILSVVTIPYNSLMPELSQNYDERTSISGFRMAFSFLGNLVAAAGVALIVDNIYSGREVYRTSYPVMGLIIGGITIVLMLICFLGTKERVHADAEKIIGKNFWHDLKTMWQVKEMRLMIVMFVLNQVGADIFMALIIFYLKDVMLVTDSDTSWIMAIPLVIAVASVPLWVFLGEKLGKRQAYIAAAFFFLIPLTMVIFAPAGNLAIVIVIAVLIGIGSSATQVLPWSMLPDVVELDEYQNGVRREGFFMGATQLIYKVCSALTVLLFTTLIGVFGYVENAVTGTQPASALLAIRLLMGLGTALFYLAAALFAHILPLTKERFDEVKRLIEERKAAS